MYNSSITEEFEDLCSFPQPPFKRIKKEENKKKIEELIQNIHVLEETYDGTEKSSLLEMASLKSQQMLSMALGKGQRPFNYTIDIIVSVGMYLLQIALLNNRLQNKLNFLKILIGVKSEKNWIILY